MRLSGAVHLFVLLQRQFSRRVRSVSRVAGWRSPRTRERRVEWQVGGLCTRESGWFQARWSSCHRVPGLDATTPRCWVLHNDDPFRCGVTCLSDPLSGVVLTSSGSMLAQVRFGGWSCSFSVSHVIVMCSIFGRVDIQIQSVSAYNLRGNPY
jgi:hypothetical protein